MKENRSLFDMKILEAYLGQRNSTGSFPWFDATACLIFLPSGLKRRTISSLFMQMFLAFSLCVCCQKIYHKDYNTARKILLRTMQYYEDFFIWKSVVCYGFSGDELVNQFSSSILLNKLYAKLSEHYYRTWEIWVFSLVRILPEYRVIVVVIASAQLHLTKSELRLSAHSNPACGMLDICYGENLWQRSWLEIRLKAFHQSTILQKQFIIIIIDSNRET